MYEYIAVNTAARWSYMNPLSAATALGLGVKIKLNGYKSLPSSDLNI